MARLVRDGDASTHVLRAHAVVGRARECTLCLRESEVSAIHASISWTGSAWLVQDLNSRNGTFVDNRRLAAGERLAVARGAQLGFGRPQGWTLGDDGPPEAMALPLVDGPPITASGGLLALPSAEDPAATIFRDVHGWRMELRGDVQAVEDGRVIQLGEQAWRLVLPEALPATWEESDEGPTIDTITLRFAVHRNEEYVELVVMHGVRRIDLEARAHHYVLLTLARRRLADQADPGLSPAEHGWLHQELLLDMLRTDASRLHIDIYRARRQLGQVGVLGAMRLIERRPGTRMLRIGVARLDVQTLRGERDA
jgi:hypothetical protein